MQKHTFAFTFAKQNVRPNKSLNQHMKRIYNIFLALLLLPLSLLAAKRQTPVVQPQFWWAGMHNPSLQVLIHAQGVGQSDVTLSTTNVSIDSIVRPQNANYLLLYLNTTQAKA